MKIDWYWSWSDLRIGVCWDRKLPSTHFNLPMLKIVIWKALA